MVINYITKGESIMAKLVNNYPIVIEKGKHRLSINAKENEQGIFDVRFTIVHKMPYSNPAKIHSYTFEFEADLIEEAINLINEQMNRAIVFCDHQSETELLDILLELDKLKKILRGDK